MPEHYEMQDEETSVVSYDISVIPNDFNVMTINSLIESGVISMPAFQRNYVWTTTSFDNIFLCEAEIPEKRKADFFAESF